MSKRDGGCTIKNKAAVILRLNVLAGWRHIAFHLYNFNAADDIQVFDSGWYTFINKKEILPDDVIYATFI